MLSGGFSPGERVSQLAEAQLTASSLGVIVFAGKEKEDASIRWQERSVGRGCHRLL
jgi:hypothetical protein